MSTQIRSSIVALCLQLNNEITSSVTKMESKGASLLFGSRKHHNFVVFPYLSYMLYILIQHHTISKVIN